MRRSDRKEERKELQLSIGGSLIRQRSMNTADRDLDTAIGWNRFNLRFLGVWPDPLTEGPTGLSRYRFLIPGIFMVGFIAGPQTVNLPLIWGDIDLVTENLATANIPVTSAFLKLLFIRYHENALRPLMKSFFDDWHRSKTDVERRVMLNNARTASRISIGCTVLTQIMVTLYLIIRISTVLSVDRDQYDDSELVLYKGYFPYRVRDSPVFELMIVSQMLSAYSASVSYTSFDSFVSMLVLHACGQFANLRARLEHLADNEGEIKDPKEFRKELGWVVERQEHLNWFAATIEESFNSLLLIQMLLCTVQLCFQGFQTFQVFMYGTNENFVMQMTFLFLFVMCIAVHLYIYCYVGEMLLVQSVGIGGSAYGSKWYNVPAAEARCLLIVMCRSTIPVRLTAGKFGALSLEMFSSILRTSLGYLSVLLTIAS